MFEICNGVIIINKKLDKERIIANDNPDPNPLKSTLWTVPPPPSLLSLNYHPTPPSSPIGNGDAVSYFNTTAFSSFDPLLLLLLLIPSHQWKILTHCLTLLTRPPIVPPLTWALLKITWPTPPDPPTELSTGLCRRPSFRSLGHLVLRSPLASVRRRSSSLPFFSLTSRSHF